MLGIDGFDPSNALFDFLVGALVGASIHLGGALWYTKRQRERFEQDVDTRLLAATDLIIQRVTDEVVPKITGSLGGTVSAEVRAARTEMIKGKMGDEDKAELAEYVGLLGKKEGARAFAIKMALDRHRTKARQRKLEAGGGAPRPPPTAPSSPAAPAGPPRPIPDAVLAQLEAAGFKREVRRADGGDAQTTPA